MVGVGVLLAYLTVTPPAYRDGKATALRNDGVRWALAHRAGLSFVISLPQIPVAARAGRDHNTARSSQYGYCLLKYTEGRCPKGLDEGVFNLRPNLLCYIEDDGTVWSRPVGR
jgi:hypothetical protein